MTTLNSNRLLIVAVTDDTAQLISAPISVVDVSVDMMQMPFGHTAQHYLSQSPALLIVDGRCAAASTLIQQLRAIDAHRPIVAALESHDHTLLDEVYTMGVTDTLMLPIHPATLRHKLKILCQPTHASTARDTETEHDVWAALYGLRQISHVYEIGSGLMQSVDLQTIFQLTYLQIIRNVLQTSYLNVVLLDANGSSLRCEFAMYDGVELENVQFPTIYMPNDWLESLVKQRQTQVFDINQQDGFGSQYAYKNLPESASPQSVIFIPLISHNWVNGFLISQSPEPNAFSHLDQNLLILLVSSVAIAIENAQMHITNQQQIAELESLYQSMDFLFESKTLEDTCLLIAEAVVQSFIQADCGVMLLEQDTGLLIRQGRAGNYSVQASQPLFLDGQGLVPEALRNRFMLYVPDVTLDTRYARNEPRTRSELVVPLVTPAGTLIGALDLQSTQVDAFSTSDQRLISAFAERAALAIENAKILEQNERQIKELESLYRSMDFLFDSNNLTEMCERIAQAVVQEFRQADCGVLVVEPEAGKIVRYGRAGSYSVNAQNTLFLDGQGLVPEAIRSGNMLYAPDVRVDKRYLKSEARTRSELVVPLATPRGIIGALDLQSFNVDAFSAVDQRLIVVFAERAALALENMQLNDKIARYVNELELRVTERTVELQRARSYFEAIFNSSSDGKAVIKPDGTVVQSNPAFLKLFGLEADCPGESLLAITRPSDTERFELMLQEVITREEPLRFEMTVISHDSSMLFMDVALYPVDMRGVAISNLVCSLRDMTHQKQLETDLRLALAKAQEVNELRMRIVTTVSHEFRTPLTRMLTSIDLLSTYGERLTIEQQTDKFNKLRAAAFDMVRILDDVLAVNNATSDRLSYNPDHYDLNELCRDVVEKMKSTSMTKVDKITLISDSDCVAWVDHILYRKIVTELLTNAIKFTLDDAIITCRLECSPEYATLSVEDNGIGISDEDRECIFDAFCRGVNADNVPGVGLGLVVVKRAVELHNGTTTIVSSPEKGTTFTVQIPQMGEK